MSTATHSTAAALAERNWQRNLAAIDADDSLRQLAQAVCDVDVSNCEWLLGRDGSLTGRIGDGWLGGSGLPARLAEAICESADVDRASLCLVAPNHLQHALAILRRMEPSQSLLVTWPDAATAAVALRCADVADDLATGRLVPACGPDIGGQLGGLVKLRRGWVVPGTLFLPGDSEAVIGDRAQETLQACKQALEAAARHRGEQAATAVKPPRTSGPIVLVAGTAFRLLHDPGRALASAFASPAVRVDPDAPRQAAALAISDAAAGASAVVTVDFLRSDLPNATHTDLPWVTWITQPRPVPAFTGGLDAVVLADERFATDWHAAGWPEERMTIAGWPVAEHSTAGTGLLLAYDLPPSDAPESVTRFSSQTLLWDAVWEELSARPFALRSAVSPSAYLTKKAAEIGVELKPAAIAQWLNGCVEPAFIRGIGDMLARCNIRATVAGAGWEGHSRWAGPVEDAAQLDALADGAAVVVDPTMSCLPAVASLGRPVISTNSDAEVFLRRCRAGEGQVRVQSNLAAAITGLLDRLYVR